ncbi:MAG: hypothetical protein GY863_14765 [bacterium]|nr:hypothetical protein [bacterium]
MDLLSLFKKRTGLPARMDHQSLRKGNYYRNQKLFDREGYFYDSRSGFYRYLRDRVPIISSAVWHWVRLCNTPGSYHLKGSDSQTKEAEKVLEELCRRMNTVIGTKRTGMGYMLELFFQEVFTCGSFTGQLMPLPSGRGIDYFRDFDSSEIEWKKREKWIPYLKKKESLIPLDSNMVFHYGLGADRNHPEGISFLASVEFVTGIEQKMVEDMAKSSHNAGNPHLHVKVAQPERFENESDSRYIKRANKYFDNTVNMFQDIDPDDNIFTWSDIEVTIIGGSDAMPSSWKLNREQVIEDVITGMKLFPWVVGRSHGTTKNWVQAQFNLLMQVVDSIQEEGRSFAEWILNTELELRRIPVKASYVFSPNQDPFLYEREKAYSLKFDTVDKKVKRGYISKNEGAREMGYYEAFEQDKNK